MEVVDTYQYLGINLKPSGSMQLVSELFDKANRAWFAISNVLYKYKRLPVSRAFKLFDSLIKPIIALFSCEFWLPTIIPKKCFSNKESLLKSWESLHAEVLNQKICRLLLSVHKRCSRLAAIGELGRYPF